MPGPPGRELRFFAARGGAGPSPLAVARTLARLDEAGIGGELELVAASTRPPPPCRARAGAASRTRWDAARGDAARRLERPVSRGRADLERPPRAGRARARPGQPGALRRHARLPLPLRADVRLRRLAGDGAALPRAGSTSAASPASSGSCERSRTRSPSAPRVRSGTSAARSCSARAPDPASWLCLAGPALANGVRGERGSAAGPAVMSRPCRC